MTYIVQADLTEMLSEGQLVQLTNDDKTGIVITDRVTRAMVSAESEINSYLGTVYIVPLLAPIPDIVQKWAVDITVYFLYQRRQRVPEDVRKAYEDAIARLRDVAAGKMSLGVEPVPPPSTVSNQGAVYGPPRLFSRESLESF